MSSEHIPIDNTFGAAFVGVIVAAVLHGVSCAQAWYYFTHQNDKWFVKTLVSLVILFDTIHQILISHTVYTYLVTNYNNPDQLQLLVWSVLVEVLFNVRIFSLAGFQKTDFVAGIYRILSSKFPSTEGLAAERSEHLVDGASGKWAPLYSVSAANVIQAFLVLSEFGCVLAFAALSCVLLISNFIHYSSLQSISHSLRFTTYMELATLKELSITVNALGAAGDVVIAFSLCVLLHRSRTGFQRSDSMINKLIAVAPTTFLYIAFFFCLGRLYSNSLLATLNARKMIRAASGGVQSTSDHNNISFREIPATKSLKSIARLHKRPTQTNISIMIDTTKEFATDVEPSTQSRQMDDITDALEMEIMSAIADEEKQSGSSNMSLDSTSKVTFIYEGEGKIAQQV
ncbi:hypothetical protein EYR40_008412 [Pleurotus pulmonarius]|nr:hypothetical protein EYR36_009222 [Pleurotus pulmonarius]KAF4593624.1 hypothetical protein EYR40_008412 [Pleurotus pulmonarius]